MTTTRWFMPASYVFAGAPRTMNRPPDACTAGPASFAYAANASWFLIARYVTTQYALAMMTSTRVISRQSIGQDAISARAFLPFHGIASLAATAADSGARDRAWAGH